MRIYQKKTTATASSGAVSFNTQEFRGEWRLFQVKPATATTRYTVTVTNDDSVVVFKESRTGNLVDERIRSVYGIYTVAISSATNDEDFVVTIDYVDLQ